MRRALLAQLPALTRFYGLRPWEVDLLTYRELNRYLTWMDETLAAESSPLTIPSGGPRGR